MEKNNSWANCYDYKEIIEENKKFIKYKRKAWFNNFFLTSLFDKLFKKIFLKRTLNHFEKIWKPYGVIISDDLLKFHNWDVRKEISEKLRNF